MQKRLLAHPLNRRAGTSLVELLVVIVVFLIGILAVVQVFPGGFRVLSTTKNNTVAKDLGRSEIERLKGLSEQLPEQILPVAYVRQSGGQWLLVPDPTRNVNDMAAPSTTVTFDGVGNLADSNGDVIGNWKYLSGPNVVRRVVGEGRRVPNPTIINGIQASVLTLAFGPILYDPQFLLYADGTYGLLVYGNDMAAQYGVPGVAGVREYEYFLNQPQTTTGTLTLPAPVLATNTPKRRYRVSFTFSESFNGKIVEKPAATVLDVDPVVAGTPAYQTFSLNAVLTSLGLLDAGATYIGAEPDSIRVARVYQDVTGIGFSPNAAKPEADPYEYIVPQDSNGRKLALGVVYLNPQGYNHEIVYDNGRRVPLVARVDYDVLDWRILHEDFRIPEITPANYRLPMGALKVYGNIDVDGVPFTGLNLVVPSGGANFVAARDFVLMDLQTGGVFLYDSSNPGDPTPPAGPLNDFAVDPTKSSYTVDKSRGTVRFNDYDRDDTNGLQLRLLLPDGSVQTVSAAGRAVRAFYEAKNEWAVQPFKAAESYSRTFGLPGVSNYYVGTSSTYYGYPAVPGENAALASHRIYFPESENGRKVVIDTIWFDWADASNVVHTDALQGQAFSITRDRITGDFDPYVDIAQTASEYVQSTYGVTPAAVQFDFAKYGYAVRGVKGASVNVRVFWNPQSFHLDSDSATNFQSWDKFQQGYRRQTTETFLTRGVQ